VSRIPVWLAAALLAGAAFLPWLGSVGLFDPWEPHYAEVSRQMLLRADWVHPWWREAGFFSKPPLVLWTGAAGLALAGDLAPEWGLRLPVALLGVLGVAVSAAAVARLSSRRAGLLAGAALVTSPFVALLARQAIPDVPLVALSTAGGLCFAVALLDDGAGPGWGRGGFVLLGFAALAKGPVGVLLPAAAIFAWLLVTGGWGRAGRLGFVERVGRIRLPIGPVVFLAIAVPWYAVMAAWPGRDESGWTFVQRFWLHDHLRRVGVGAHVPVQGGGWIAYLGWLAVGTFPWVAAIPGGLGEAVRTRAEPEDARGGLSLLCALWAGAGYLLVGFTATRYPHYALPIVPPLLVLAGLFLDRLVDEGPGRHAAAGLLGAAALGATGWALAREPRLLTALFTYDPRRSWPGSALGRPGAVLGLLAGGALLGLAVAAVRRSGRIAAGSLVAAALLSASWISWVHWPALAAHWTQREVFAVLRSQDPAPDEPVVAWLMNWRGETFYGKDRVREVADPARMREIAGQPGRIWVVTEAERLPSLEGAAGPSRRLRVAGPPSGRYRLVELVQPPPATEGAPR
jgi:4-amino-4-deoxy-L-arabinose transferase-like glycosyltransferase